MEASDGGPVLVPIDETSGAQRPPFRWGYGGALALASGAGSVLVIPYSLALIGQMKGTNDSTDMIPFMLASNVANEVVVAFLLILLGLVLGRSLGLDWPPLDGWGGGDEGKRRMSSSLSLAAALGVASALLVVGLEYAMRSHLRGVQDIKAPPWWAGLLASIGAGIREEIWLRLGTMTFFVWVGAKLARATKPGPALVWGANPIACLLFGAMHLPQAALMIGLTGPVVVLALLGNGIPGLAFGWLYWRKGLVAAMVSHTVADVVLKVILP